MKNTIDVAESKGRFEDLRSKISFGLIVFFLVLPWLRIGSDPVLLFDIWNRHFIILGRHFFSHDAPLLFFILITVVFAIILATAIWGRIWCGWACPQTVFISFVYRKIEKWILGNYLERQKFYSEALDLKKIFKTSLLWLLFIFVSYLISHSFLAYFVGAPRIIKLVQEGPAAHWTLFLVLQIFSLLLAFNFGFFRERFCHHLCPYGRFQNVLLDTNSLGVIYMKKAGEPRKAPGVSKEDQGACVDCGRCVRVCPMKIDIRNGFQLECINCAACIDACDEVMIKVNQPTGLIQLTTADEQPIQFFRFRVLLYAMIITVSLSFLTWQLLRYGAIELELNRARQNAFIVEDKGSYKNVTNHFEGFIKNQRSYPVDVEVRLNTEAVANGYLLTGQTLKLKLEPFENKNIHLFVSKSLNVNQMDESSDKNSIDDNQAANTQQAVKVSGVVPVSGVVAVSGAGTRSGAQVVSGAETASGAKGDDLANDQSLKESVHLDDHDSQKDSAYLDDSSAQIQTSELKSNSLKSDNKEFYIEFISEEKMIKRKFKLVGGS